MKTVQTAQTCTHRKVWTRTSETPSTATSRMATTAEKGRPIDGSSLIGRAFPILGELSRFVFEQFSTDRLWSDPDKRPLVAKLRMSSFQCDRQLGPTYHYDNARACQNSDPGIFRCESRIEPTARRIGAVQTWIGVRGSLSLDRDRARLLWLLRMHVSLLRLAGASRQRLVPRLADLREVMAPIAERACLPVGRTIRARAVWATSAVASKRR